MQDSRRHGAGRCGGGAALAGLVLGALLLGTPPAAAQMPGSLPMCPSMSTGFLTRCLCWGAGSANAPVWGTGIYARESSICAAARHAGVIGEQGGAVRVIPMPAQASYRGSYRNGVTSGDKGSSTRSFRVEAGGGPQPWGTTPRAQ